MRSTLHALVATDASRERIADLTHRYWRSEPFTGRYFELLRDDENPNRITDRDLTAVSMLSVTVPAEVAIWILDDGSSQIEALLAKVPADADFWADGHHLDKGAPLQELWEILGRGSWPQPKDRNGLGPTKRSKLLAAKRPALVPVWDRVIGTVLGPPDDFWASLRAALDEEVADLWERATAGAPEGVTLLRRIDAALWMHGTGRSAG